jgi:hypothetical protein
MVVHAAQAEGQLNTPVYLERIWAERAKGLFEEEDEAAVIRWLSDNWKRHRVVIVGSGFTKNASRPKRTSVPLWGDLSRAIARDLGVPEDEFDALQLPDMHAVRFGSRKRLRALMANALDDAALTPGRAHDALWASNPAAIITTNFLDTVLEKSRPRRGQVVVVDKDLGVPMDENHRHLVYFHGHRRRRDTWVAGRQEYEALPSRRPLVQAKVRQLLAEYPALIVGYSLTDPDFHLIYGDTWRAMGKQRPKGLALLPSGDPPKNVTERRARAVTRAYWETLGLTFVTFSPAISYAQLDGAYARFFKLTEQVTTFSQLLVALQKAPNAAAICATCKYNLAAGDSALDDQELADVFGAGGDRAQWWREVIAYSLDEGGRKRALEATKRTNLHEHSRLMQEGERRRAPKSVRNATSVPLREELWIRGSQKWKRAPGVAKLLTFLDGGKETVRQLQELLAAGVERDSIRAWVGRALMDPEFSPRAAERSYIAAFSLLSDGRSEHLRDAYRVALNHGEDTIVGILSSFFRRKPVVRRIARRGASAEFAKAFQAYGQGDRETASLLYERQYETLLASETARGDMPNDLLAYFAAQGSIDCTTWETDLATAEDLWRRRDVLARAPDVRRWRDRIRKLTNAITKNKASGRSRDGYEDHGGSWSASPGELWHEYERVKSVAAPLSIRRELLAPLLGSMPSAEHELSERLSNCVKGTGEWLETAFESGAFSTNRNAFFKESPRLESNDRVKAAKAISRQMFGSKHFVKIEREARLEVLNDFSESILADDLGRVSSLIADSLRDKDQLSAALKALTKASHTCSWSHLSRLFRKIANSPELSRELAWTQRSLPWEHWADCDRFWDHGGIALLTSLTRAADTMLSASNGERLWALMDFGPKTELLRLTRAWIAAASERLNDRSVVAVGAGLLTAFPTLSTAKGARKILREARRDPDVHLLGVVIRAAENNGEPPPAWALVALTEWAKREGWRDKRRQRTTGPGRDVAEASCLVALVKHTTQARRKSVARLLQLAVATWSVLPELAPILRPEIWADRWGTLLRILHLGGHSRLPKSWLLNRVRLVTEVMNGDQLVRAHFMRSAELSFMRTAIIDGLAHGDSSLANHAVYLLPQLCQFSTNEAELAAVAAAISSAADDMRIGVTHGAAFAAAYITEIGRHEQLNRRVVEVAKSTHDKLRRDILAVVRRQSEFGRVKAIRDRREAAGGVRH